MEHLLTEVLGKVEVRTIIGCSAAVAGATILGVAGVPGATMAMPTTSTTLGVFESSRLPRWFLAFVPRILPLFTFPLFPFFLLSFFLF